MTVILKTGGGRLPVPRSDARRRFGSMMMAGGFLAASLGAVALAKTPALDPLAPPAEAAADSAATNVVALPLTAVDLEAWLDGFIPSALARGDIAGAVVVVVRDGEVLLQKGYGFADVAAGTPVSADVTLFRPGSVSKLVTWTAVMQQVEQGRLDLDADINTYLDFTIPPFDGAPVTLRHLMTHTAGFEDTARHVIGDDPADVMPLAQYLQEDMPARVFAPGTTPAYSNYGAALAGYIASSAAGMAFDDYVDANIFAPLGMDRSSFRQPLPDALAPMMSKGYRTASGTPQSYEIVIPAPAGSLAATGADMARFMIAHLDGGRGLLRPETAALMHDTVTQLVPPLDGMALGFYEQSVNGRRAIGHAGDTEAFHSDLWLFPSENLGLFMSVNGAGAAGAAGALRTALFEGFADRYLPGAAQDGARVDAATAEAHVAQMVGRYAPSRGAQTTFLRVLDLIGPVELSVGADGSLLAPAITGLANQPLRWVETAPYVWSDPAGDTRIAAVVEDGRVMRWSADSGSPWLVFDRVPWHRDPIWLRPLALVAVLVVALTALSWPLGAVARRSYGGARMSGGPLLTARRLTRAASWLVLAALVGWAAFISLGLSSLARLGGPLDPLLLALQVITPVAVLGLAGSAVWDAVATWLAPRGWWGRSWSALLLASALVIAWVAVAFNLISWGLRY